MRAVYLPRQVASLRVRQGSIVLDSTAVPEDRDVRKSLNTLYQLYETLKGLRAERHAMEFETVETYMTFDELGGINEILLVHVMLQLQPD